jgi:hypothetical protein
MFETHLSVLQSINNNYGTAILAFCTALYLFVTWLALDESRKLFRAKYMPIVKLSFDKESKHFIVTNVGPGIGINIRFDDFHVFVHDFHFYLKFGMVANLEPGKSQVVIAKEGINGKELSKGVLTNHMASELSKHNFHFTGEARDIMGNIYYEKVNMGKDGIFVIKHESTWLLSRMWFRMIQRITHFYFVFGAYLNGLRRKLKERPVVIHNP